MDDGIRFQGAGGAPTAVGVVGVLLATGLPGAADRPLAVVDLETVVGREDDCDVVLASGRVSRRHARLWAYGDRYGVEDLGSLNGTYVNRHRVLRTAELVDGDRLTLADVELQFQVVPAGSVPKVPRRSGPMDGRTPRGATAPMPPAVDLPVARPTEDLRATHLLVALVASLGGAVTAHLVGFGRTGALVLALVFPLAVSAVMLRAAGRSRPVSAVVLSVIAATLTVAGVTALDLRAGHAVLPGVSSGGTFVSAAQVDRLLGRASPPPGCAPAPTLAVSPVAQHGALALRVSGRCFGPGSSVNVSVGSTVMGTVRADRYGVLSTRLLVDPDASCPLGQCTVTAHELQSLRSQQVQDIEAR